MQSKGLTRLDLIVAAVVVAVTAALLLPALGAGHATDKLTGCLNRTRGLSSALLKYAEDHGGILPPGKYGHQGGNPVYKVWMELLYEGGYVPEKVNFQCPSDNMWDNQSLYYDYGPAYPDWWASYAYSMNLCDLYWSNRTPRATVLANHVDHVDTQVLLGESESNFISGWWFATGSGSSAWSFRGSYENQFPFRRHGAFCMYAMLDGHTKAMRVPASDAQDYTQYEAEIRAQFETCSVENSSFGGGTTPHVCFWNRYKRGLAMTEYVGN
jgi:hypothetical protein